MTVDAYVGLRRRKQTPWTVKFGDAFASRLIAVGGIGTIAAILLVVFVLFGTAWPLFRPPSVVEWQSFPSPTYEQVGLDEQHLVLWGADRDGKITVQAAHSGELLAEYAAPSNEDRKITANHLSIDRATLVLGFSDGTFQVAEIGFKYELLNKSDLPSEVVIDDASPLAIFEGAVFQQFDATSVRRTQFVAPVWSEPRSLGEQPVSKIDFLPAASKSAAQSSSYVAAIVGDEFVLGTIARKKALIGKKFTESFAAERCKLNIRNANGTPLALSILNGDDHAVVVWPNGTLDRFSLQGDRPTWAESASGTFGGAQLTFAAPLLARQTLLCADDSGKLVGWNIVQANRAEENKSDSVASGSEELADPTETNRAAATKTPQVAVASTDGFQLIAAHELQVSPASIRSITSSQRNHLAAVVDSLGEAHLAFITTDELLMSVTSPLAEGTRSVAFDPSDSALVAIGDAKSAVAQLQLPHPESSFATFFGAVWYEGYSEPKYIWQSSAGTEKAESKLSLVPLVFGTLKATLYAMLVSVPLALMAAIYTSEFMLPAARVRVKPVIELMASLPSVVLGFVAALVVAPLLQTYLMHVLVAMLVLPFSFVVAGNLWNLLPLDKIVRFERFRLLALLACLPISLWLTSLTAPIVERVLFDGDIVRWINSGRGSAVGGWMMVLTPLLVCLVVFLFVGPLKEWTRGMAAARTPRAFALFALIRLIAATAAVVVGAWLIGTALESIGLDARGTVFGDYQNRNALLVGIALGFCVIPIIYTISDDALQAVPKQLRSASLGCGATPWQTTMRVVVPSAMSGLFSAVMIGLGRAVGETMVVLMAAGNTPVMDWNPFNGFRTLSATLATELPEAAKGSTHFRTLFLAALLLFVLTLVANTLAEFVRIRFRKRASQL